MAQAKYQQIADRLRTRSARARSPRTTGCPASPTSCRQYDASRNTVRLALALLTNQGLVVTRQGLGTFVQAPAKPFTALLSRVKPPPGGHHASTALPIVSPTRQAGDGPAAWSRRCPATAERGREAGDRRRTTRSSCAAPSSTSATSRG